MKNDSFDTRDVLRCCKTKLHIDFSRGSGRSPHDVGWAVVDGKKVARITVSRGRKPIPPHIYRSMAGQLLLSVPDFDAFLDCTLGGEDYQTKIRASGAAR